MLRGWLAQQLGEHRFASPVPVVWNLFKRAKLLLALATPSEADDERVDLPNWADRGHYVHSLFPWTSLTQGQYPHDRFNFRERRWRHHLFGMDPRVGGGDCCRRSFVRAPRIRLRLRSGSGVTFIELAGHIGRLYSVVRLMVVAHSYSELRAWRLPGGPFARAFAASFS